VHGLGPGHTLRLLAAHLFIASEVVRNGQGSDDQQQSGAKLGGPGASTLNDRIAHALTIK